MANPPFTAFTGTDGPDTAQFNSMMASLMGEASTRPDSSTRGPQSASASATQVSSGNNPTETLTPTTLSTLPSSSSAANTGSPSGSTGGTSSISGSSTAAISSVTNSANSSDGGVTASTGCNSISCSPGLKAAVAVPVVVGCLAIIALIFFLARRRKRTKHGLGSLSEKPKKKWTRHLRIFSFDAELLGGGRFSSTNSVHSGQSLNGRTGSQHRRDNPSIHSIEEATPPYRDAVGVVQHPGMSQVGTAAAVGGLATSAAAANAIPRSASRASAPPPYSQTETRPQTSSTTPLVTVTNPFSDSNPVSPIEGASPFRDPSEDGRSTHSRPTVSRTSSIRTGLHGDDNSTVGGSDAGSIREAQVGRHVSIASGGRTITNIRNSSQSPPNQSPPAND